MNGKKFSAVVMAAVLALPAVAAFANEVDVAGAVYTMTNAADNAVVVSQQNPDPIPGFGQMTPRHTERRTRRSQSRPVLP